MPGEEEIKEEEQNTLLFILSIIANVLLAAVIFITYPVIYGLMLLANAQKRRIRLSARTQEIMADFFPSLDLSAVEIVLDAVLFHPSAVAQTWPGSLILWRRREFDEFDCSGDMQVLLHELVHIRQMDRFPWGAFIIASTLQVVAAGSFTNNEFEKQAKRFAAENLSRLKALCNPLDPTSRTPGRTPGIPWFWLLWGS